MSKSNEYAWASAGLEDGRLKFETVDGLERALRDGFFYVAIPTDMNVVAGDRFATNFYRAQIGGYGDDFRGFDNWTEDKLGKRQGYATRPSDQVEQFFLEGPHWRTVFPPELDRFVEQMKQFGIDVLRAVLAEIDLPKELWPEATGEAVTGRGLYTMAFNHYRPSVRARGLNVHKDSGWVTILRALAPGLQVRKNGEYLPILPRPDAFIVNFGCTMEILMRDTQTPVAAVEHRVVEQQIATDGQSDRFSYGMFVDNSLDPAVSNMVYRYKPNDGLVKIASFDDFLDKLMHNAYSATEEGLYEQNA